jgi:hypothetical protein
MVHILYEAVRNDDFGGVDANIGLGNPTAALQYARSKDMYERLVGYGADEAAGFSGIVARSDVEMVSYGVDRLRGMANFGTWLAMAARIGDSNIVNILASEKHELSRALRVCVYNGGENRPKIADILLGHGALPDRSNVVIHAARTGQWDMLERLIPRSSSTKLEQAMYASIRSGVLKSVEILSGSVTMRSEYYDEAVERGDPAIIEFVRSRL